MARYDAERESSTYAEADAYDAAYPVRQPGPTADEMPKPAIGAEQRQINQWNAAWNARPVAIRLAEAVAHRDNLVAELAGLQAACDAKVAALTEQLDAAKAALPNRTPLARRRLPLAQQRQENLAVQQIARLEADIHAARLQVIVRARSLNSSEMELANARVATLEAEAHGTPAEQTRLDSLFNDLF